MSDIIVNYKLAEGILHLYGGVIEAVFTPIVRHKKVSSDSLGYGLATKRSGLDRLKAEYGLEGGSQEKEGKAIEDLYKVIKQFEEIDASSLVKLCLKVPEEKREPGFEESAASVQDQMAAHFLTELRKGDSAKIYNENSLPYRLASQMDRIRGESVTGISGLKLSVASIIFGCGKSEQIGSAIRDDLNNIESRVQEALPVIETVELDASFNQNKAEGKLAAGARTLMDIIDLRKGSFLYDL